MSIGWYIGNANDDAGTNRGWLLGHFMSDEVRKTDALEVKWGIHPAGQRRDGWTATEQRTTLLLLISGRFRLDLPTGSVTLERQGDYVVWGKGIDHSWQAEDDSTVITVRWPSSPVAL
ncbi:MAG: signal peptidase I [Mycobacterium sp.]|nr:signal peptidase I [Mycobacterium sp.]